MHIFSFSPRLASYLNILVISQGSAATYLRCGGMYNMIVVGNFFLFKQ